MLKPIIETEADFTALPEPIRAEYKKNGEGKYVISLTDGYVAAARLNEMRDRNEALVRERDTYKETADKFEDFDPDHYEKLKQLEKDLDDSKLKKVSDIEKMIADRTEAMQKKHKTEVEKLTNDIATANDELAKLTIDAEVGKQALALQVRPEAIAFIRTDIRSRTKMEKGKPVLFKPDGTKDYNDRTQEKTIGEAVTELVAANDWMKIPNSGGGGDPTKGGSGGDYVPGQANPWKEETYNLTQAMAIAKKDPALAARLKKEAGKA